jgi:uncharacterized caspase-like protein
MNNEGTYGVPVMQESSEMNDCRNALLIGTSDYADVSIRQLQSPKQDVHGLAKVLGDPQIGSFDVQTLLNVASGELLEKIEDFCSERHFNDLLLIYLSCHGLLDDHGRLYYAATNTSRQRLAATAISAAWLNERLEDCRARRQIVVLDCCHSGAFTQGIKGDSSLALERRFELRGRGRVILTASRSTEYSFESNTSSGETGPSVFSRAIIEGLRTGDADLDKDGYITVTDLYRYVENQVRTSEPRQTPGLWMYGAEGDLRLAYGRRGAVIRQDGQASMTPEEGGIAEQGEKSSPPPLTEDAPQAVSTATSAVTAAADPLTAEQTDGTAGPSDRRSYAAAPDLQISRLKHPPPDTAHLWRPSVSRAPGDNLHVSAPIVVGIPLLILVINSLDGSLNVDTASWSKWIAFIGASAGLAIALRECRNNRPLGIVLAWNALCLLLFFGCSQILRYATSASEARVFGVSVLVVAGIVNIAFLAWALRLKYLRKRLSLHLVLFLAVIAYGQFLEAAAVQRGGSFAQPGGFLILTALLVDLLAPIQALIAWANT